MGQFIDIKMFNALRAFTILTNLFTLLSAILATVRLNRQQRRRVISKRFEWSTHAMAVSSLACVTTVMALDTAIVLNIHAPSSFGYIGSWYYGLDSYCSTLCSGCC